MLTNTWYALIRRLIVHGRTLLHSVLRRSLAPFKNGCGTQRECFYAMQSVYLVHSNSSLLVWIFCSMPPTTPCGGNLSHGRGCSESEGQDCIARREHARRTRSTELRAGTPFVQKGWLSPRQLTRGFFPPAEGMRGMSANRVNLMLIV